MNDCFESGLTAKLMGTVTAVVVFCGSMTLFVVLTTGIISHIQKTRLDQRPGRHENQGEF
jgi:hypothetical protein